MTKIRKRSALSFLLVIVMVFSLLPTAAFAAELPDEHICTDEGCALEHEEITHDEGCTDCAELLLSTEEEHVEETSVDGENEIFIDVEESPDALAKVGALEWVLDPEGVLHIGGYGYIPAFSSAEDQPWWYQREQITAVMFDYPNQPVMESMEHWFEDCTNLDPENILDAEMCVTLSGISLLSYSNCGVLQCTCTGSCQWGYKNYQTAENPDRYHIMQVYCLTCGKTDGIIATGSHTFNSSGVCTLCGYSNGSGGGGGGGGYTCSHSSTYTTWSGCDWYEYCRSCGELVDYGTSHGTYSYGAWEYYNSTRHRRSQTCNDCGETSYATARHSTATRYTPYNSTQHQRGSYCATCSSYVGSTTRENHSFTYGIWTSYNGTQHRRTKSCATCGYSEYEYANHSLTYGNWTVSEGANYSNLHKRTVSCSCGYSTTEYEEHNCYADGEWEYFSADYHRRQEKCDCGYTRYLSSPHVYSTTKEQLSDTEHSVIRHCSVCGHDELSSEPHSFNYGEWQYSSEDQHRRVNTCACGFSTEEYEDHTDPDGDDRCDFCGELMRRFSVTLPANLSLVVSKTGEVYAATTAQIINNSSTTVRVFGIELTAENGWTLAPYTANMANAKVNSKAIGFKLNDLQTTAHGDSESIAIPYMNAGWRIPKNTGLPLDYDAVVTATSEPISEQVLTVTFIIGWFVD